MRKVLKSFIKPDGLFFNLIIMWMFCFDKIKKQNKRGKFNSYYGYLGYFGVHNVKASASKSLANPFYDKDKCQ